MENKKKKMTKAEKDMLAIRIVSGIMGGLMLLGFLAAFVKVMNAAKKVKKEEKK